VKHASILFVVAAGAAFGWFAPDMSGEPAPDAAEIAEADAKLAALHQDQWSAGEEVLPRAGDGHFYADVSVNGTSAHMLVDTGASIVALTGEDAAAMGVEWNEDDVQPVAQGANGAVYGVNVVLEQVQLGQIEAQNVQAVVVPEGLGISLLGQSFLSKVNHVEVADGKMTLGG
jgi:aspartyl protease family protein